MENEYLDKEAEKHLLNFGRRIDLLRPLKKKAKTSKDKSEISLAIDTLSDICEIYINQHVVFNKDNQIIFTTPINTKKLAKEINRTINNPEKEIEKVI